MTVYAMLDGKKIYEDGYGGWRHCEGGGVIKIDDATRAILEVSMVSQRDSARMNIREHYALEIAKKLLGDGDITEDFADSLPVVAMKITDALIKKLATPIELEGIER